MTHHLLPIFLVALTALLLSWRWFHVIVSKREPNPLTKLDIKKNELLEAERVLFSAYLYLNKRRTGDLAADLLLWKLGDISDALEGLERYGLPEEEQPALLTYEQNRVLDDVLPKARDRAVLETLGAFDHREAVAEVGAVAQADGVPYSQRLSTYEGTGHITRYSDSSLYDEVCTLCGSTDTSEKLSKPCPSAKKEVLNPTRIGCL